MKRSVLILLLLLMASIVFAGANKETEKEGDNSLSYILDKGNIVLGLDDNFPPMGFRGEDGEITGFDIDLAKEVCKRLEVELKLQPIDWDAKILDLNSKDIDIIWNGLTINDGCKISHIFNKQC